MTRRLFWEDPYLTQCDTRVTSVAGNDVTVEATVFYAFSGGQESDAGTIAGRRVVEARTAGNEIIYTLEDGDGLAVGDAVAVAIDWQRRYRLMRLHFAAEIVLELAYRHLPGIAKIGAHIAADKARIDFAWPRSVAEHFPLLGDKARAIVASDQKIATAFSDAANGRRYWQIAEFAPVPCGGTHLKRTGEIGPIMLKRRNLGKGKERIEIYISD